MSKVVSHCHDSRDPAIGVFESCYKEDFLTWYAEWQLKVTGVDVDVPSPYEVESKEDLELAVAIGAAGAVRSSQQFESLRRGAQCRMTELQVDRAVGYRESST